MNKLIKRKHNGLIKNITGIGRSGKSYVLFNLFHEHLRESGVDESHIIEFALDDRRNKDLRNPNLLLETIILRIIDKKMYYVVLDEIQIVPEFKDV